MPMKTVFTASSVVADKVDQTLDNIMDAFDNIKFPAPGVPWGLVELWGKERLELENHTSTILKEAFELAKNDIATKKVVTIAKWARAQAFLTYSKLGASLGSKIGLTEDDMRHSQGNV